jgi:hypothetical protein
MVPEELTGMGRGAQNWRRSKRRESCGKEENPSRSSEKPLQSLKTIAQP